MKPTDFSKYLTDFLTKYLVHERGASLNTIKSYRDTYVQFINYIINVKRIKLQKITLSIITRELIVDFLEWLQHIKKCAISTRNSRLAALHSFLSYVQLHLPDYAYEYQKILTIKSKKYKKETFDYMSIDGIRLLLRQPDFTSSKGRRDIALLSFIYDTGARVQEVADLKVEDIYMGSPYTVRLIGKGQKTRIIPLIEDQIKILRVYMAENKLLERECRQNPMFFNNKREKLTRGGISYIVKKYGELARNANPDLIPVKFSCHTLRHSKAMHLLQAGVNLIYIRDLLGHVSIQTTEIYARADSKQKQEAIRKAFISTSPEIEPLWANNNKLLEWLKSF